MDTQLNSINRSDLGKFISDPRTIVAFENLSSNQDSLIGTVNQIAAASFVSVSLTTALTNDRVLAGSSDILLTDAGPKGNLSIELSTTGVSAGSYGSPAKTTQLAVDSKGRLSLVAEYILNTDNVTEGSANLFFTTARSRNSISAGTGLSYVPATGVMSISSAFFATGTYTPVLTNVLNIDASTPFVCQYVKVGDMVTVSGVVNIDPTALSATQMNMSLPIASNFIGSNNCGGAAYAAAVAQGAAIYGESATDTARFEFLATTTANAAMSFSFTYRII